MAQFARRKKVTANPNPIQSFKHHDATLMTLCNTKSLPARFVAAPPCISAQLPFQYVSAYISNWGHQRKQPAWQQRPLEARDFHSS